MSDPFQVMPPLTDAEYAELRASIEAEGVITPILVDQHGRTIDGHHRRKIAAALGIDCPTKVHPVENAREARGLAYTANLNRRHLTREQRRDLLAASIRNDPDLSDRQHAERVGADHKTAGSVRAELESGGEIPHLAERTGADGKGYPAHVTTTTRTTEATKIEHDIDLDTGEILDGGLAEQAGRDAADAAVIPIPGREWAVALYPDLDVPGALDEEIRRIADGLNALPTDDERRFRLPIGVKWLQAQVRKRERGDAPADPPPVARWFTQIAETAVLIERHGDEMAAAWDSSTGITRQAWADNVDSIARQAAALSARFDGTPALRRIK